MSQIRLYLDEDILERSFVKALRNAGIDVATTAEANNLSCTDEEQLIWATAQGRVIYTLTATIIEIGTLIIRDPDRQSIFIFLPFDRAFP